jgi:putative FmdB family regulatory protein
MPLFEFQCRSCGHRFETLVLSTSRSTPACPACHGTDLEKLVSVFGVGSGGAAGRSTAAPARLGGG